MFFEEADYALYLDMLAARAEAPDARYGPGA